MDSKPFFILLLFLSYVEEAVDYPSAGGGMYAHVNKKKFNSGANDSTSGYPDIIHQVIIFTLHYSFFALVQCFIIYVVFRFSSLLGALSTAVSMS